MIRITNRKASSLALAVSAMLFAPSPVTAAPDTPIRLALFLPTTGTYAGQAQRQLNGMRLALSEANYTAGGRKIEAADVEEPQDTQAAVQKVKSLTTGSNRIDGLLGVFTAPVGNAIRDQLHNSKTVTIITNTHLRSLTGSRKSPYIFRVSGTAYANSHSLGDWVGQQKICKTVISLAANNSVGQEFVRHFLQPVQASGATVVDQLWPALGSTDFSPYLTKILQARPACVYVWLNGPDAVRFVQQADQYGLAKAGIQLLGTSFADRTNVDAQGKSALGVLTVLNWDETLDNPESKHFSEAYTAKFGVRPDSQSFQGYLGAKALLKAIDAVEGNVEDGDRLAKAFEATTFVTGDGGNFRIDPATHTREQTYSVYRVVDGKNGKPDLKNIQHLAAIVDPGDDVLP
ncbi:ABC transporter substrate-binding protein [Bradyrhizobium sp. Arg237L]|uniref:ABC transporter substrate-binding protein n=1 Tax=Bradyrhizobium sp. Arg237L TaxID=3003352 RepID=UPI00249F4D00|nr:ABC transporter substrate-binding protein [Bradyrhizobium sp. Arg237L]MDI4238302.1 ABC transporter substrate-binding protein [Bradyrhizobium sp. Arg237L]